MEVTKKIENTLEKMIEKKALDLKNETIKPANFLATIKHIIVELINKNYDLKAINEIVNNTFNVNIKYTTFYRWVKRNIIDKSKFEKSKIEEIGNHIISSKNQSNKEAKNDLKSDVKTTPKKVDVKEFMNSNNGTEMFNKYNNF